MFNLLIKFFNKFFNKNKHPKFTCLKNEEIEFKQMKIKHSKDPYNLREWTLNIFDHLGRCTPQKIIVYWEKIALPHETITECPKPEILLKLLNILVKDKEIMKSRLISFDPMQQEYFIPGMIDFWDKASPMSKGYPLRIVS